MTVSGRGACGLWEGAMWARRRVPVGSRGHTVRWCVPSCAPLRRAVEPGHEHSDGRSGWWRLLRVGYLAGLGESLGARGGRHRNRAIPRAAPRPLVAASQWALLYVALTVLATPVLMYANRVQARRFAEDALERQAAGDVATEGLWKAMLVHAAAFFIIAGLAHANVVSHSLMIINPADYQIEQWKMAGYLNAADAGAAMVIALGLIALHARTRYRLF